MGKLSLHFRHHFYAAIMSLGRLCKTPVSGVLTVLVMAFALMLPAGLYAMFKSVSVLETAWQNGAQISLFLKKNVTDSEARLFYKHLSALAGLHKVDYLSKENALAEFRKLSGFDATLDLLPQNPFPAVIILYPDTEMLSAEEIKALVGKFSHMPLVEKAQLDIEWLSRLAILMSLGRTLAIIFGAFLGLAVLLIMTNTIRLIINSRAEEIEVMKLVGATDSFVRRPFLYSGIWLGILSGLLAFVLIYSLGWIIYTPLSELARAYQFTLPTNVLDLTLFLDLLFLGGALGYLGARMAVGQHLMRLRSR